MAAALTLARRGLGAVWPNPAVGCVLVRERRVVGRGWTGVGGTPHAETEALRRAGAAASGATAYVSLEPCAHHGRTPPCADALVAAGIERAVIALEDPDPRVAGAGIARLGAAGIPCAVGLRRAEAADLNAGFLLRLQAGRPLVALKLATTLDGRIAARTGASRWITGEAARARAHLLRASHDAVMVGIGTALTDDPRLDCRLPGMAARSPLRIVVDSRLRLPAASALVRSAGERPLWVLTTETAPAASRAVLEDAGAEVIAVAATTEGRVDPAAALAALGGRGLTRLLVEGGAALATALLGAGLVDRLYWFRSSGILGADAIAAIGALALESPAAGPRLRRCETLDLGDDTLETLERAG